MDLATAIRPLTTPAFDDVTRLHRRVAELEERTIKLEQDRTYLTTRVYELKDQLADERRMNNDRRR